ncbi:MULTISPECIES: glycosyltransferase [unclassified Streptomyces]|uniref:glycosyltransferase n=1 Tax=unclassified Streptomyces TaxID=2593676 RepID=UPI0036286799
MNTAPTVCVVVIPAHNEAATLPAALRSVRTAARHPALTGIRVLTVVTADDCGDDTAAVARALGAHVVGILRRNVGAARAAGVARALDILRHHRDGVWIASTDADTVVPAHWLAHQLHHARGGWDCVVGTVRLAPHPSLAAAVAARHDAGYFAGRPSAAGGWSHPHVHGANLGVAAASYHRVGGFPELRHSEDRALVAALERAGRRIVRTDQCPVLTSGRTTPRAPYGLGALLASTAQDLPGSGHGRRGPAVAPP